ncbi:MAG: hypothetical protein IPJ99_04610 [Betaproteobacteria bacterium]|nr:hypothetical protein [Betaproteobacteria bacterium]MBK8917501.1 hypothetical protein [Betaproteobacteria bacterium]
MSEKSALSSSNASPTTRKLTTIEIVIFWICGFLSLAFYGLFLIFPDGRSSSESQALIIKSIQILVFAVISPLAVVFHYLARRYFEKNVIDSKGGYVLVYSGSASCIGKVVPIIGGLIIGGAAWSFVGLMFYLTYLYW